MTHDNADIANADAEGFSLIVTELRRRLAPLVQGGSPCGRHPKPSGGPVVAAFATRADIEEGFDGGLGLIALTECVLGLEITLRMREACGRREVANAGFGIRAVLRQAERGAFSVLVISGWRSLSCEPLAALYVFDRLSACGVFVVDARNGCLDRATLCRLVRERGPRCGSP